MAMNIKGVNKSRSFNQNNSGTENVAVMIAEVHVKDVKAANPADDYAIAYLLDDAFGKVAKFSDKGEPQTIVKIKIRAPKNASDSKFTPLGIYDLQVGKKKGSSPAMGAFPTVVLENAYLDREDVVQVKWLSVSSRAHGAPNDHTFPRDMTLVESLRYDIDEKGERSYRQNRYVAQPEDALTFHDLESFKAAAVSLLVENPAIGGGRPGVMLRFLDNASVVDPKAETVIGQTEISLTWDRDAGAMLSAEESVNRWIAAQEADPEKAGWIENIRSSGSEAGYTSELIPFFRYITGTQTLSTAIEKGYDDSVNYKVPVEDRENNDAHIVKNNGETAMVSGFAPGTMLVKRVNEDGVFFATKAFVKNRFGPIFLRDELITPNLPDDVRAALYAKAVARGEARRNANNAERTASRSNQSQPAAGDDSEIPFGEPDHTAGGLSMS